MNERYERSRIKEMKEFNNKNTDRNYKVILQKNYISVDEMRNARIISLTRGLSAKRNKKLCLTSWNQ